MAKSKNQFVAEISNEIAEFLLESADYHEQNAFIESDPISIPHRFSIKQDIEIIGFLIATIAWGNRVSIIRSGEILCQLMDNAPYDFVINSEQSDRLKLQRFVHRTFNGEDLIYFIEFLHVHFLNFDSLEDAFVQKTGTHWNSNAKMENRSTSSPHKLEIAEHALIDFRNYIFSLPHNHRTEKHVSSVLKNSACKRLNMYLRWMVRKNSPVDFGIWNRLSPKDLYVPLDVHVMRVANQLGLVDGSTTNWQVCKDLTAVCRKLIPNDPVKIDFALFGIGIEQKS